MLIAVTGADGSGKSTACRLAAELLNVRFGAGSARQVSVWDAMEHSGLFASKAQVVSYLGDLDGFTRTLFIYHALSRSIDMAMRERPKFLLVEGYWYKYAITEIAQGVPRESALGAAAGFSAPDRVICIDIDPATAWGRKSAVSQYEQGVGSSGSEQERFLRFQSKLAPLWKDFEERYGKWTHVSAKLAPNDVAAAIVAACLEER